MVSIRTLLVAVLFFMAAGAHGTPGTTNFVLSGPADPVAEGYFQLSVEGLHEEQRFRVQMAADTGFTEILAEYQPAAMFRQLSLSGFDSGVYYFRAVSDPQISNTVRVEVGHYPLWQAFTLFAVGLLMFTLLCTFIIRAHHSQNKKHAGEPGNG